MLRKIKLSIIATVIIFIVTSVPIFSEEIQRIETPSKVSFTGFYNPIGAPDPILPEMIVKQPTNQEAKPDRIFPQTNDSVSFSLIMLGISIISLVYFLRTPQKKI